MGKRESFQVMGSMWLTSVRSVGQASRLEILHSLQAGFLFCLGNLDLFLRLSTGEDSLRLQGTGGGGGW